MKKELVFAAHFYQKYCNRNNQLLLWKNFELGKDAYNSKGTVGTCQDSSLF